MRRYKIDGKPSNTLSLMKDKRKPNTNQWIGFKRLLAPSQSQHTSQDPKHKIHFEYHNGTCSNTFQLSISS